MNHGLLQHLKPNALLQIMTPPAIVALIGYIIMAIVVLLPYDMYVYDETQHRHIKRPYNFASRVLILAMLLFPFILGIYSVNCMVVGDCKVWSWIIALATLLWACIVIISSIVYKSFYLKDMQV
jgi:cytochrome bd-type quinol oxidase subunit 2